MRRAAAASARALLGGALLAVAGCGGDICEEAAEICADQQEVAAPDEREGGVACDGTLAEHAQCIVEADSCAPDVVERCWAEASGDGGEGGGA